MTYFFIFPAFLVYLLFSVILLIVTAIVEPAKKLFPYAWRAFLGSVLGFITANALLWASFITLGIILNYVNPPNQIREILIVPPGLALFLGPIPVSIIGIVSGIISGFVWAHYAKHKANRKIT